jgi:hypothetical protein
MAISQVISKTPATIRQNQAKYTAPTLVLYIYWIQYSHMEFKSSFFVSVFLFHAGDGKNETGFFQCGFFGLYRYGSALFIFFTPFIQLEWDLLTYLVVSKHIHNDPSFFMSVSQESHTKREIPPPHHNCVDLLFECTCTQILLALSTSLIMWDTYFHQTLRDALIAQVQTWLAHQVNAVNARKSAANSHTPNITDEEGNKCSSRFHQESSVMKSKLDKGQNVFTADEIRLYMNTGEHLLAKFQVLESEVRAKQQGHLPCLKMLRYTKILNILFFFT